MARHGSSDKGEIARDDSSIPRYRPLERFWPYAELDEEHTEKELATLDPELRTALFGAPAVPFSITLVFPAFEGADYARALDLARGASEYRETGRGEQARHRARFFPSEAAELHALFTIVGRFDDCEVLVDDRPFPFARELWLPLFWFLIVR